MTAATPPRPVDLDVERGRLTADLFDAIEGHRLAKARFAARTRYYQRRHSSPAEAEIAARSDYLRQQAIADTQWFRDEGLFAATALLALGADLPMTAVARGKGAADEAVSRHDGVAGDRSRLSRGAGSRDHTAPGAPVTHVPATRPGTRRTTVDGDTR